MIDVVVRMDGRDPGVERFLHSLDVRILHDVTGCSLLTFSLLLFVLVGGRRRRDAANLEVQCDRRVKMLLQGRF